MRIEALWQRPETAPLLQENDVHLWRLPIRSEPTIYSYFRKVLSPDEKKRAQRFRVESARNQFVNGRGFLRRLLSDYLHCPPEAIQFARNKHDKPYISYPKTTLRFNLSHSGNLVLCGLQWHRELGVDIEERRPNVDIESISRRYFARSEIEYIFAQDSAERLQRFFRVWTRKEAVIKALGTGISDELLALDIPINLLQERTLCQLACPPLEAEWTLISLSPAPGYEAALAVPGPVDQVHLWAGGALGFGILPKS